ncbi:hypothetical protein F0365_03670 [Nonlabens sp. Ci31]|jgi:uncharacterized membrane protein YhaH (DUF805 family)|uniref:hypothetical protein n=1 Tax=Nonlabens sp. Ci31 TaxID=2608253 RepID=UPI0014649FB6|nr:hypothetical protein [Nonlabens sp. Ci31]QJP33570.1 hypothetical protein F0365_03670 [Nonlabens sp. Ci31]
MAYSTRPQIWFWTVAIIFLLWNLIGLGFLTTEILAPELLIDTLNQEQLEFYNNRPSWYLFNYGIAVLTALFAAIAVLFKRKMAVLLSLISLLTIFISTAYNLNAGVWDMMNRSDQFFFILVPLLGLLLWVFARNVNSKGWLS